MPIFKTKLTVIPFVTEVEADNYEEAMDITQRLWENEPCNREVDTVDILEINGQPVDKISF